MPIHYRFSRALKEAVENSHDAIQVTRDSTVMVGHYYT